jgi:hypothetical protein
MSTRTSEEWPYVPPKPKRRGGIAQWEQGTKAARGSAFWTRWGVVGLVLAVTTITILGGIAMAALQQDEARAMTQQPGPAEAAPGCVASDPHLQELLREHRRAVFGS